MTNYKAIIESVLAKYADQIVAPANQIDGIGRSCLPLFIEAMPADERPDWGVLEKRTSKPYSVPYDILVKRSTREHFDVLTSRPVSGNKADTTGPRQLIATWGAVGPLPKDTWHWCDWRATQTPIVPLAPMADPEPDPGEDQPEVGTLESRVADLEAQFRSFKAWAGSAPK